MNSPKTMICYYPGAYGPTIRIDVKTREWLQYFKKCIISLKKGVVPEVKIECLDNIELDNLKTFTLNKVQHSKYSNISVSNSDFIWSQNAEEILTIIGLIDGLLNSNNSGHQYLTSEGDCVIIVLSFKEQRLTSER